MKNSKRIVPLIMAIALMLVGLEVWAQAPPPGGSPAAAPFGIFTQILLMAGFGYGIKKMRQNQNNSPKP
jgi:predicted small integral membrane protein